MTGLLESTVYLSVTALAVLLFKWIFKNKLSAKWHVLIWALLALRLVLPSLPESSLSIFNAFDIPDSEAQVQEGVKQTDGELSFVVPDVNENQTPDVKPSQDEAVRDDAEELPPVAPDYSQQGQDAPETQINETNAGVIIRNAVYTVSLVIFLYFVFIYIICIRKNSGKPRLEDKETLALLEECKKKVGVKRRVYIVNDGDNPMLMGLFKPTIILPDGYTESEKKDILIHELCHLKSGDIYLLWLAMIVLCLNWYNPIIWVCFFTFRRDVEVYCDERVLRYIDSKKDYAALLVKTALRKNSFIAGTTSLQNGEKEVERRVKYMAYFKKPHYTWTIVIVLIAVLIGVLFLTNPVGNVQEDNTVQIYTSFINGTETVEIRGENYSLTELVDSVGTVNQSVYYYFQDMNGDGVDELHLKTSMAYFIFTIKDEKMSLWYRGTIYENPTEDGNIIYIRHGGAPTDQTVIYISLDENGNEVYRDTVAKYDENEDGTFETFFRDNEKISELEYSEISGKYLSRDIIYLARWNEIKPQQDLDLSKETTSDYSEVYNKDGKVLESSKNFYLEDRTEKYFFEVYGNDGSVLWAGLSEKCPVFIHLDGSIYELRHSYGTFEWKSNFFDVEQGTNSELFDRPFYLANTVIARVNSVDVYDESLTNKTGMHTNIVFFDVSKEHLENIVHSVSADFLNESTSWIIEYIDDTHICVTYYTENGKKENKKVLEVPSLTGKVTESEDDNAKKTAPPPVEKAPAQQVNSSQNNSNPESADKSPDSQDNAEIEVEKTQDEQSGIPLKEQEEIPEETTPVSDISDTVTKENTEQIPNEVEVPEPDNEITISYESIW